MVMEKGERSDDGKSEEMDDIQRRQLSPDQRGHSTTDPNNTYLNYDVINDYASQPSPQSLAVVDWSQRQPVEQPEEPVWVVPYREPIMMGYSPVLVTPQTSLPIYDDDWSNKKPRRGRRRAPHLIERDEPPRSCARECMVYCGGFVILAIALAATIAIVYTYNSNY